MSRRRGAGKGAPIVLAHVMRELQTIADAAERRDRRAILEAGRRAQSLLDRLRAQFVFEVVRPGSPSAVRAVVEVPAGVAAPIAAEDPIAAADAA